MQGLLYFLSMVAVSVMIGGTVYAIVHYNFI